MNLTRIINLNASKRDMHDVNNEIMKLKLGKWNEGKRGKRVREAHSHGRRCCRLSATERRTEKSWLLRERERERESFQFTQWGFGFFYSFSFGSISGSEFPLQWKTLEVLTFKLIVLYRTNKPSTSSLPR